LKAKIDAEFTYHPETISEAQGTFNERQKKWKSDKQLNLQSLKDTELKKFSFTPRLVAASLTTENGNVFERLAAKTPRAETTKTKSRSKSPINDAHH